MTRKHSNVSEQESAKSNEWPRDLELTEGIYNLLCYYNERTATPNAPTPLADGPIRVLATEMMRDILNKKAEGLNVEERLFICGLFESMLAAVIEGERKAEAMLRATGLGRLYGEREGEISLNEALKAELVMDSMGRTKLSARAFNGATLEAGLIAEMLYAYQDDPERGERVLSAFRKRNERTGRARKKRS